MLVKTGELTGPALDWAVATIQKLPIKKDPMGFGRQSPGGYWIWADGFPPSIPYMQIGKAYSPSTNWEQGGPIIERGRLSPQWDALWEHWIIPDPTNAALGILGPTFLIAAMRCFVTSKLGNEVDIPRTYGEL